MLPDIEIRPVALVMPQELECGDADLALARLRPEETDLEVEILATEGRSLAMAADHPLCSHTELRMAELGDEASLTQPASANPAWREARLAEQRRHGLPGRVVAEVHDPGELFGLLASGRGVCLVPAAAADALARPGVAFVPVVDADSAVVSLVWRRGAAAPSVLRAITNEARDLLTRRT